MALLALLRRMGRDHLTAHGFRSTFRDWAAERTSYPREVAEMALAHAVGDKVEAAYRRGDLFNKRRQLMGDWAAHCTRTLTDIDIIPRRRPGRGGAGAADRAGRERDARFTSDKVRVLPVRRGDVDGDDEVV